MWYVYFLKSLSNPKQTYVGITDDVLQRLKKHNKGGSPHTARFKPWELVAYLAVPTNEESH